MSLIVFVVLINYNCFSPILSQPGHGSPPVNIPGLRSFQDCTTPKPFYSNCNNREWESFWVPCEGSGKGKEKKRKNQTERGGMADVWV